MKLLTAIAVATLVFGASCACGTREPRRLGPTEGTYVVLPAVGCEFQHLPKSVTWRLLLRPDGTFMEGNFDREAQVWHTSAAQRSSGRWALTGQRELLLSYDKYWGRDVTKAIRKLSSEGLVPAAARAVQTRFDRTHADQWVSRSGGLRLRRID